MSKNEVRNESGKELEVFTATEDIIFPAGPTEVDMSKYSVIEMFGTDVTVQISQDITPREFKQSTLKGVPGLRYGISEKYPVWVFGASVTLTTMEK